MRAPAHAGHGTLLCKLLQCLKVLPERHVARRVQPLHRKGWSTNKMISVMTSTNYYDLCLIVYFTIQTTENTVQ